VETFPAGCGDTQLFFYVADVLMLENCVTEKLNNNNNNNVSLTCHGQAGALFESSINALMFCNVRSTRTKMLLKLLCKSVVKR
jgi:hypothetical protein